MPLTCSITTPEELLHESEARLVVVPASDGELGILATHAPMTALLGVGELRIEEPGGERRSFYVRGGFVQVLRDRVIVLATEAAAPDSIDKSAAEAEVERLRRDMPSNGLSIDEREEWNEKTRAARARARIATGSGAEKD